MAGKPDKDKSFLWLSKYLALGLTLPATVAGGYVLGAFLERTLHWTFLPAAGVVLGFAGGLMQVLKELSRDEKRGKRQ